MKMQELASNRVFFPELAAELIFAYFRFLHGLLRLWSFVVQVHLHAITTYALIRDNRTQSLVGKVITALVYR